MKYKTIAEYSPLKEGYYWAYYPPEQLTLFARVFWKGVNLQAEWFTLDERHRSLLSEPDVVRGLLWAGPVIPPKP